MNDFEKWQALYTAVNQMMARLGADGEISTAHGEVDAVMSALYNIDGGVVREQREVRLLLERMSGYAAGGRYGYTN